MTLPFSDKDDWRWRWLITESATVLHRIVECDERDEDAEYAGHGVAAHGSTACGLRGWFSMPSVFARIGRPRCKRCCDKLGIPKGDGAPYNHGMVED